MYFYFFNFFIKVYHVAYHCISYTFVVGCGVCGCGSQLPVIVLRKPK